MVIAGSVRAWRTCRRRPDRELHGVGMPGMVLDPLPKVRLQPAETCTPRARVTIAEHRASRCSGQCEVQAAAAARRRRIRSRSWRGGDAPTITSAMATRRASSAELLGEEALAPSDMLARVRSISTSRRRLRRNCRAASAGPCRGVRSVTWVATIGRCDRPCIQLRRRGRRGSVL